MSVAQLQLVKRRDTDAGDIDTVDLLSLPIELQYEGWQQATPAQQGQATVDDVITLLLNAGNDDTLATALQSIDSKVKQTSWGQDPLNPVGVWLRSRLSTETNQRQSFIKALKRSALTITDPLAYQSVLQKYSLGITRMPVWENVFVTKISSGSVTANGFKVSYSVDGDAHARVSTLEIYGKSVGAAADLYREVWLGAKGDRYGVTPANFAPVWNVAAHTLVAGTDVTQVADATALASFRLTCDFGTVTTMAIRALSQCSEHTANPNDQRGKYILLLRAKTSDASLVCNVRACMGYQDTNNLAYLPRYPISSANGGWKYYTLGTVKIPATDGFWQQDLTYSTLGIAAEKVSGSGSLYIDSFILIPAEHSSHALYPSSLGIGTLSGVETRGVLTVRPDQKMYATIYATTPTNVNIVSAPMDAPSWSFPTGSNNVIIGCVQSTYSISTDTTSVIAGIYPSYSSLRGAA